ncbi:MAG: hypothetical protein BGO88_04760 [Flavobacterium sp. 38-13]|uniref:hypothetical protein n=1 Tax=Flavobacterium sp. 38-13 TaxID=1896168 RepID=UPI0009598B6D|nr:hypothetical protein [Flavobacterium sp. 38-13]OJX55528.1 MAG: hypothetical protein BGO88_04760 [Flavobacterium sp. 38-13]
MTNQIEKLTELQAGLGYKFNGEINPVALLGLFGESAEVLHETILMKKEQGKFLYGDELAAASSVGAIIDNIKKKIRKNKDLEIEVFIDPVRIDAFDLELADTLYYLNILASNRGKTLGDYAELAFNKVSEKMQNKPVPELPNQEKSVLNSELFSDYFKEADYNLLEVMNKIIERNKGIHESDNYTSGEFLVLEVLIKEEGDELLQLVPNIEAYMAVCRQMFNTSEGDNIFCFSLAVDFHQRYFNTWIYYDSEAECYYDKNND